MAKFIYDSDLNSALEKIIEEAEESIFLISPFIKLHARIKRQLELKKSQPHVCIEVVFGKNEDNVEKSISKEDFEFLKSFPSISILYEARLHAKYYANEKTALLTSMNLYDFSQNNNIEFGILMKSNSLGDWGRGLIGEQSIDSQAFNYFIRHVIDQAMPVFSREPEFKDGFLGLTSKYMDSKDTLDQTDAFFTNKALAKDKSFKGRWQKNGQNKPEVKPPNPFVNIPSTSAAPGFCIRTGVSIPFNTKRPMSDEAYKSWSKFSNPDYAEKFCHFSGEPSNGETTFAKPILRKNWSKAKGV